MPSEQLAGCPFNCTPRDFGMYRLPDSTSRHVFCRTCNSSGPWGDSDEEAETRWNQRATPSASAVATGEGEWSITKSALLSVLERLRTKNRNLNRDWYVGWDAAIQCLIGDVTTAAISPSGAGGDAPVVSLSEEGDRANRIEWLFRKKLGAEWAKRGREYIDNYELMVQGGGGIGRDTQKLYSGTVDLIREMVRTIETLALRPDFSELLDHDDEHFMPNGTTRYCRSCGIVRPHDGWKKRCPKSLPQITTRTTPAPQPVAGKCRLCGHVDDTINGICQTQIGSRNWAYCLCRCDFSVLPTCQTCGHDRKLFYRNPKDDNEVRCWHEDEDGFCGHRCDFPVPAAAEDEDVLTVGRIIQKHTPFGVQLPFGINGLRDDLLTALAAARATGEVGAGDHYHDLGKPCSRCGDEG